MYKINIKLPVSLRVNESTILTKCNFSKLRGNYFENNRSTFVFHIKKTFPIQLVAYQKHEHYFSIFSELHACTLYPRNGRNNRLHKNCPINIDTNF